MEKKRRRTTYPQLLRIRIRLNPRAIAYFYAKLKINIHFPVTAVIGDVVFHAKKDTVQ